MKKHIRIMNRAVITWSSVSLLFLFFISLLIGCGNGEPQSISDTGFALGTTCSIKLYGVEHNKQLKPALAIASEIEDKMSTHTDDSEVAKINAHAGSNPVPVSLETYQLIKRAKHFSALSNGVFDLTVGPLVELWDIGSGEEEIPSKVETAEVLKKVNYKNVVLNLNDEDAKNETSTGPEVYLKKQGMRIDLGAIAKGYAADKIVDYLKEQGVEYGIVNLGGNVYAFGKKYNRTAWKIGIQSPEDERGSYIGIAELVNKSVVTSGKYERYFVENGVRYHHILSTEDGFPIENGLASVSIISSDATEADALSTLVFGLGLEKGLRFTEQRDGVEAILITEDNVVFTTTGLRESFELTAKDFKRGESKTVLTD